MHASIPNTHNPPNTLLQECAALPQQLVSLLEGSATVMTPPTRKAMVNALILLRHRGMLPPHALLRLVFRLFAVPDKGGSMDA